MLGDELDIDQTAPVVFHGPDVVGVELLVHAEAHVRDITPKRIGIPLLRENAPDGPLETVGYAGRASGYAGPGSMPSFPRSTRFHVVSDKGPPGSLPRGPRCRSGNRMSIS